MTDEEVFEKLLHWAWTFGCDVMEADKEDFQADGHEWRRGVFRKGKCPGTDGLLEIVLQTDLSMEQKVETMAHEVSHLILSHLLRIEYQRETHEPTASILGKCLIAVIREDFGNPLFKISGIADLVKQFLEQLKTKMERCSTNLFMMDAAYWRWKNEVEGEG